MLVVLCKPQTPHTSARSLAHPSDSQCSLLLSCLCKQNHCAGFFQYIFFFYFVLVSADAIRCKNINVTAFTDVNSNWDQAI